MRLFAMVRFAGWVNVFLQEGASRHIARLAPFPVHAGLAMSVQPSSLDQPKSLSWRSTSVGQIAVIMRYGEETRGFAGAPDG
jgi:hypothetical protein